MARRMTDGDADNKGGKGFLPGMKGKMNGATKSKAGAPPKSMAKKGGMKRGKK